MLRSHASASSTTLPPTAGAHCSAGRRGPKRLVQALANKAAPPYSNVKTKPMKTMAKSSTPTPTTLRQSKKPQARAAEARARTCETHATRTPAGPIGYRAAGHGEESQLV